MVVRFDAHALPFRSGLFDLVTGYHVIEHLHTPSLFVSEVRRVMARGGMAIIITPNRRRINSLVNRMLRILHSKGAVYPMNPDHVHEFDLWELARLAGSFFRGYHVKPIGLKFLVLEVELLPRALRVVGDQLVAICRTPMDQGTI
jgi:ubiquinone/menaquinone biosynthesis C-methylase UbiE